MEGSRPQERRRERLKFVFSPVSANTEANRGGTANRSPCLTISERMLLRLLRWRIRARARQHDVRLRKQTKQTDEDRQNLLRHLQSGVSWGSEWLIHPFRTR